MSSVAHQHAEPRGLTLADLVALVVGSALAVAAPWPFEMPAPGTGNFGPWLGTLSFFQSASLALERACLALLPVVLARRIRYGGFARPAEFLVAACGMPSFDQVAEYLRFTVLETLHSATGRKSPLAVLAHDWERLSRVGRWELWHASTNWDRTVELLVLACGCAAALAIGRRRLPGWAKTALVLLAWLGFLRTLFVAGQWLDDSASEGGFGAGLFGLLASLVLFLVPLRLFYDVPACAVWHRLRKGRGPRLTWLEWAAMIFAGFYLLASYPVYFTPFYPTWYWGWNLGFWPATIAAPLIALRISRRRLVGWWGMEVRHPEAACKALPDARSEE
jgi:hypothetical protein